MQRRMQKAVLYKNIINNMTAFSSTIQKKKVIAKKMMSYAGKKGKESLNMAKGKGLGKNEGDTMTLGKDEHSRA